MSKFSEATDRKVDEIKKGQKNTFSIYIDQLTIDSFAQLSGDWNPLHCDEQYARDRGYSGPVVHGAMQIALVSQAVGMWVIGRRCLIGALRANFKRPLTYPCKVEVASEVIRWSKDSATGQVRTRILDEHGVTCYSDIETDITFHSDDKSAHLLESVRDKTKTDYENSPLSKAEGDRPLVVVTGASGGILSALISDLAEDYDLALVGRRTEFLESKIRCLSNSDHCVVIGLDFIDRIDDFSDVLDEYVGDRPVWGVIHGAALQPNSGSLLEWDRKAFHKEIDMSGYLGMALARWLSNHCGPDGGRMIFLGSNYALHNSPQLKLVQYGLLKSLLTNTARALSPVLARQGMTINVIAPDFIPVGINAELPSRLVRMQAAVNPTKRLCTPQDVGATIKFLLSDSSGFVSGQEIVLHGGVL